MTIGVAHVVRRQSIRVALTATAMVGALYLAVAVAVVLFVANDLTAQVDQRLTDSLSFTQHRPPPGGGGHYDQPPEDRPGGAPVLIWTIHGDGRIDTGSSIALPAGLESVTTPTTGSIGSTQLRFAGRDIGGDHVVVAASLEPVERARATIVLAELLIGSVLLAIVFLGAVAVGRRVAAPIDRARQRAVDFTADASHELRTPLSVIEAHTSLALAQPREAAWYRTAFEKVDRESKRMRRLLDDLLWLARFDAGRTPPNAEPVDLSVLASQTADRFGVIAETRRLRLGVAAPTDGAVVSAPPELLDRLLGVLLDNACKYAPEGGSVDVRVGVDGSRVTLTVDDSGPGIAEDERERVFDRFHRASETAGGAGLGLAIGDAIVRATGGRWKIGTSPAGGAQMRVSWPAAFPRRPEAAPRPGRATAPQE